MLLDEKIIEDLIIMNEIQQNNNNIVQRVVRLTIVNQSDRVI